jgi:hypothetical protein
MTPEQIEAERVEHERSEREYVERMRRDVGIPIYNISFDTFFSPPDLRSPPPLPSLEEMLRIATREADRCARTGDNLGRINAIQTARRLRQEIIRLTSTTIV